jgi:hypothetical protein
VTSKESKVDNYITSVKAQNNRPTIRPIPRKRKGIQKAGIIEEP